LPLLLFQFLWLLFQFWFWFELLLDWWLLPPLLLFQFFWLLFQLWLELLPFQPELELELRPFQFELEFELLRPFQFELELELELRPFQFELELELELRPFQFDPEPADPQFHCGEQPLLLHRLPLWFCQLEPELREVPLLQPPPLELLCCPCGEFLLVAALACPTELTARQTIPAAAAALTSTWNLRVPRPLISRLP
jgi:hypothetical protein